MKAIIFIGICCWASAAYGQEWKDSLNVARKYYEQGKYKEALKYYKSAERIAPKDVDLSVEKGQAAYKAGDYKTAAESYERRVNEMPESAQRQKMRSNLGESHMKQQNYQGAVEAFKEVLRRDANNEKARQRLMEAQRMLKQQQNQQQQNQQNQQQQNQQQQNNQSNPSTEKQQQGNNQQKLQDKETERKLDELSKQELDIKKRINGSKGKKSGNKANKDW